MCLRTCKSVEIIIIVVPCFSELKTAVLYIILIFVDVFEYFNLPLRFFFVTLFKIFLDNKLDFIG